MLIIFSLNKEKEKEWFMLSETEGQKFQQKNFTILLLIIVEVSNNNKKLKTEFRCFLKELNKCY